MRLKCLEMVGFKSFAEKTFVEFNPGVTAVVGPNGCGKSNIVDALRWAMGEQSARHLRGHQMEDVVFAGSDSLPPTGMAEVSITFDNEDGRSPAEYSNLAEIMVTRRLFRSGESEYAINKTTCRLKDVVELFLGSGVGTKAYSIVEQGKVDELVNSKPEERRSLIEEAAGTSMYKSRKVVAEKKLERTQQNLLRVSDIVREIERQIRTMELQAKKAERYRALRSELREKDFAYTAVQRDGLHRELAQQGAQLTEIENRLAEHLANLHSKEAENEAIRLSLLEADKAIGAQQETVFQRRTRIQTDEQKCDFYRRDLEQLEQAENEAKIALATVSERLKTLTQEIDELSKAKESFIQLSLFEESFLREREAELSGLQEQIRALEQDIDREKTALIDAANQIAYLKNDCTAKDKRQTEIAAELSRCQSEFAQATVSLAACTERRAETSQALNTCVEELRERTLESTVVTASIHSLGQVRDDQQQRIDGLKSEIQEQRSRLLSLEDLQRNYEGYHEGVRAIMLKKQQAASPNGIYGLVAEVIEAPETYEKALTAVLGDRLQYVIVKGHEEGVESIEFLKRQASGRGSFIPLQLRHRQEKALPLGEAEVIAPLLGLVTIKEGYREIAEYLLSDVIVVPNLASGLALWNRNGYYCTIVTPDGEVIDAMGTVTGGSTTPLEGNLLTQRRRIRELGNALADLAAKLPHEEAEFEKVKAELEQAETRKIVLSNEIHRLELERVRLEHENRAADQEHQRLSRTLEALSQEQDDLTAALQNLRDELHRNYEMIEERTAQRLSGERALAEKQASFGELRSAVESAEAAVTQSRIRNAALGEKRESTHANLANRLKQQSDTNEEIANWQTRGADCQRQRSEIATALQEIEAALSGAKEELQGWENRLQADRQSYRTISMQLAEIGETIKELRPLGEACQRAQPDSTRTRRETTQPATPGREPAREIRHRFGIARS